MSRISAVFSQLKSSKRAALMPYITAGDPSPGETAGLMDMLVESGADIIELGVPFSDPMADGPVVQAACERALKHNVSLTDVLAIVAKFRKKNDYTPIVLMGYLNPIEVMGYDAFATSAASAGVDGVLIVDCPPEESTEIRATLDNASLDMIFLAAPTTSVERLHYINQVASGFIYYVSLKGVTGSGALDTDQVASSIANIRKYSKASVAVGFGINDAGTAAEIAAYSDGVVVGSAVVKKIANNLEDMDRAKQEIGGLLKSMREAMDQQRAEQ